LSAGERGEKGKTWGVEEERKRRKKKSRKEKICGRYLA